MKKILSLLAMVFAIGLSSVAMDAEAARRLGGGKSIGMQRQATPPAKAPTATPTQTPASAAAAPAAASTRSKWLGPIAGLAAGLGLAALASHLGFGEGLANMLMIGLLVMAALAAIGFVMRKRAAAQGRSAGGMAYAGAGAAGGSPQTQAYKAATPSQAGAGGSMIGSGIGANLQPAPSRIPADFDVASFVRNAKVNFIRLQAANDAGNLDDIRAFTTPEMFAELKMDLSERGAAEQHTDVVQIDAEVIEVEEDADRYLVSVRFTGETRDSGEPANEAFDEIWHLTKPRQGASGWVLSGIQQMN